MTLEARVRDRGGRVTAQRRLVLEAVSRARHHVTAEEVARYLRARLPSVEPSTVYRNLEALERAGLVTHSHFDRVTKWHVWTPEPHGHLVCRECGAEEEVAESALAPLMAGLRQINGFDADLTHAAIAGVCASCRRHRRRRA